MQNYGMILNLGNPRSKKIFGLEEQAISYHVKGKAVNEGNYASLRNLDDEELLLDSRCGEFVAFDFIVVAKGAAKMNGMLSCPESNAAS